MPRGVDRYDEARLQGRLWTPAQLRPLGKLWRWIDLADFGTVTVDGSGNLSSVADKAGSGTTISQSNSAQRIAWDPIGLYPKRMPAGVHATSEKFLIFSPAQAYNSTNGISGACVAEQDATSAAKCVIGSGSGNLELRFNGPSSGLELLRRAQASLVTSSNNAASGTMNLAGFDASLNSSVVWLNGVSTSSGSDPAFATGVEYIGTAGGEQYSGKWGEVVLSQLKWTTRDRQLVDGYLAWKWGVVSNLPASHPYKNRPPLIGG